MFIELAKKRRSIRKYNNKKISDEDLNYVLEAALLAPSAANRKPCEFIVIRDKEKIKDLSKLKTDYASFIADANVLVVVLVERVKATNTFRQDAAIASTFIQLAAADIGIGTCWINVVGGKRADGQDSQSYLREYFNIPEEYGIEVVISLGYYDSEPTGLKAGVQKNKIHYENF